MANALDIPRRPLGRSGELVSLLGLGGYHLGAVKDEREALRILHAAIDQGVTFLDNCWDYHDGGAEERMGRGLAGGRRDRVFLMTKVDGRTRDAAAKQIDESLRRLRTDHLDLLQVHEVIRMEDGDRCFAEGGAMEALLAAREAGKARYLGFTGHKDPLVHARMLDVARAHGFAFDAVQMPLNVLDATFRSFEREVLPRLVSEGVAPLAMKSLGGGAILKADLGVSAEECLRYAMSLPVAVVITGIDSGERLEQALRVARGFAPMSTEEVAALLRRAAPAARSGRHEPFKTDVMHDGTALHPRWLGYDASAG